MSHEATQGEIWGGEGKGKEKGCEERVGGISTKREKVDW